MSLRLAHLPLVLMLTLGVATGAHAQDQLPVGKREQAMLPVWNNASGKLEAVLLLEPTEAGAGARWRFGDKSLDAAFGLDSGDSLGVLCDRKTGLGSALGNLANNCLLASFDDAGSRRTTGTASFGSANGRLGLSAGSARDTLPAWLSPGARGGNTGKVEVNDLTVFAQRNIGREGVVSIAGTMAKATLMTPAEASNLGFSNDNWTSRSLTVGGGYGNFGASVVGHVVDTPGQPKWEGLGLGLTWRTPWSGQLTVGADNVITRGRNPFAPSVDGRDDEGTVPYVRYEQDL